MSFFFFSNFRYDFLSYAFLVCTRSLTNGPTDLPWSARRRWTAFCNVARGFWYWWARSWNQYPPWQLPSDEGTVSESGQFRGFSFLRFISGIKVFCSCLSWHIKQFSVLELSLTSNSYWCSRSNLQKPFVYVFQRKNVGRSFEGIFEFIWSFSCCFSCEFFVETFVCFLCSWATWRWYIKFYSLEGFF